MIAKLFSLIIILVVGYTLGVFLAPDMADKYGNTEWNNLLRSAKNYLDTDRANFQSGASLVESVSNIAKPYIEEPLQEINETVTNIKNTVEIKKEQVENAQESVENAFNSFEKAKEDLQELSNFGTSSTR